MAPQQYTNSEGQGEVVNGKLYTFGGFDSTKSTFTPTDRAYVYDPATNRWPAIASMPKQNGTNFGGVTHAGFATDGEDIYWAGGYTANATGAGQIFGTPEVWKYDVSSNSYSRLPNLPKTPESGSANRHSAGQMEYLDGKLHLIGGTSAGRQTDVGHHFVLDLSNLSAGWKASAPLPNPRHHAASAVLGGKIYIIGGQKGHDANLVPQDDVHAYDPATDGWTQVQDLPRPRNHASNSAFVMDGRIIIAGGQVNHGSSLADVTAYDPAADTWTQLTPLPARRHSGIAGTINGTIYFTTGSRSKTTYKGVPAGAQDTTAPATPAGLAATGSESGIALDWVDNSEGDLTGYNVYRGASATGSFARLNAQPLSASQYNDAAAPSDTTSYYRVTAVDTSSNESGPATADASRPASTQNAVRINTGGVAQSVNGVTWQACSSTSNCSGYVSGGFPYSEQDVITGVQAPANQAVYQSEWNGGATGPAGTTVPVGAVAFKFEVPVQNGTYNVRLHFAELNKTAEGQRVFDVNIEGETKELVNFDIYKEAGGIDRAITREFPATVSDGKVTVEFIRQVQNAKISGIEIVPGAAP